MVEQMTETLREEFEKEEQMISEKDVVASISFGRFENDLLSWERWSSFSQNKYLEEVEKCSTPGSVASKKAYFEAHYKKIAARKAELLDQEQQLEHESLGSNYPISRNQTKNGSNFEFDTPHVDVVSSTHTNEPNQVEDGVDCEDLFTLEIKEEIDSQQGRPISEKSDDTVSVKEENPSTGLQVQLQEFSLSNKEDNNSDGLQAQVEVLPVFIEEETHSTRTQGEPKELPILVKEDINSTASQAQCEEVNVQAKEEVNVQAKEEVNVQVKEEVYSSGSKPKTSKSQVNKAGDTKLKPQKESQKIVQRTPALKKKNLGKTKNKPEKPIPKPAQTSTPRAAKPSPGSPAIPTSRNTTRKESSPSFLSKKNLSTTGSKRSISTSLQMSLNVAPTNSDSSFLNTTRRSLIMERMGDKEIVKRVFKAFQNTCDPSKPYIKGVSSAPQQVSEKGTERITSSMPLMPPRKVKERYVKVAGVNQTSAKAAPSSSFGVRSEERVEKRGEFLKKLDEKSKAKEVERTRLRPKSKEGANTGTHHRPESWR